MLIRSLFFLSALCISAVSQAGFATSGTIILTAELVGTVDYSVSGVGRVTIRGFAGSKSTDQANATNYTAKFSFNGATVTNVGMISASSGFWSSNFSNSTTPGSSEAVWSGNSGGTSKLVPDDSSSNRTSGLIALGDVTFDIARTASNQNFTMNFLGLITGGSSFTDSNGGGGAGSQAAITLGSAVNFTINATSGGGGGGGGGAGGAAVPEPGSVAAISLVLGAVGFRTLRRRRQGKA